MQPPPPLVAHESVGSFARTLAVSIGLTAVVLGAFAFMIWRLAWEPTPFVWFIIGMLAFTPVIGVTSAFAMRRRVGQGPSLRLDADGLQDRRFRLLVSWREVSDIRIDATGAHLSLRYPEDALAGVSIFWRPFLALASFSTRADISLSLDHFDVPRDVIAQAIQAHWAHAWNLPATGTMDDGRRGGA